MWRYFRVKEQVVFSFGRNRSCCDQGTTEKALRRGIIRYFCLSILSPSSSWWLSISVLCHSCNLSCFGRLHAHEGFDLKSIPLPLVLFVGRCCLWFNTSTNRVKTPYHPG
uniref:Uncharacterized protein n=1 Tax=Aegilops tauschii subsp. strangulata TaxID=200361 RepID=A0A453K390_AEGTS